MPTQPIEFVWSGLLGAYSTCMTREFMSPFLPACEPCVVRGDGTAAEETKKNYQKTADRSTS